ncbi:Hypothetical predicted protein [Cloeon dipterum]|uniref:Elongin-C n=1 Tax=Cloeon dipterum TaxID=197152 RepID=A0A8S1CGW4_9INSE|nr:Hypothetical predicted protein [Cloeon dipterum]
MSQPTEQDCIGPNAEFIKLIAADEKEFFVKKADAVEVSGTIRRMMQIDCKEGEINQIELKNISSRALKKVCDFIEYRMRVKKLEETEDYIDEFTVSIDDAAEVLIAANFLDC